MHLVYFRRISDLKSTMSLANMDESRRNEKHAPALTRPRIRRPFRLQIPSVLNNLLFGLIPLTLHSLPFLENSAAIPTLLTPISPPPSNTVMLH
jgi:hypothetical protein